MKRTTIGILLLAVGAVGTSSHAVADDLLGFYAGASIGESHVRTTQPILGDTDFSYPFDGQHGAWKLDAGLRPIAPLGVELAYIDFGNPSVVPTFSEFGGLTQAQAKALALFAVGYLPLPVPFLDVYGKLGVARMHLTATGLSPAPICPIDAGLCGGPPFTVSNWSANLAYGVGVQGKLGFLAIRAEYERISANGGDPDLLSLGFTWTF